MERKKISIVSISIISIILLTGSVFVDNFDNDSQNLKNDPIHEFSSAFIQLASATEVVLECSGNGFDDGSGSCMCKAAWSGAQCEVSGG